MIKHRCLEVVKSHRVYKQAGLMNISVGGGSGGGAEGREGGREAEMGGGGPKTLV